MKKECLAWYSTVSVDFLSTSILIIVCDNKEDLVKSAPHIDKDIKTDGLTQKAVSQIVEDDYLYDRTIMLPNETGDVIVYFNAKTPDKVSYETMVHEFHHASHDLCVFRGIEDEETEAYLQEYLFHTMLCKLDDYNDAQKKVKRKPKKKA